MELGLVALFFFKAAVCVIYFFLCLCRRLTRRDLRLLSQGSPSQDRQTLSKHNIESTVQKKNTCHSFITLIIRAYNLLTF